MATIAPRKNDKGQTIGWQAKIRRRGFPMQSKTFESRKAASLGKMPPPRCGA
jgi:hypothetical protein